MPPDGFMIPCPPPPIEAPAIDAFPDFGTWLEARDLYADALLARGAQVDACHRLDVAHLTERAGLAELDVRRLKEALTWERQERRRAWTRGLVAGVGLGVVGASVGYLVVR
jgi:hypothetical protein